MTRVEFLAHAFVWSLILTGLVMGTGYVIELWSGFINDWKDAGRHGVAAQRRGIGETQTPPSSASPMPRTRPFDQDAE